MKEAPLYDLDFYTWTQTQARLLAERRFAELDIDNLIEVCPWGFEAISDDDFWPD